ncbi:hypothetical protein B4N84_01905, partial [Flavobacterium sp. IR1]
MSHKKNNLCINAEKVFDWVIRPVEIERKTFFGPELEDLFEENEAFDDDFCEFLDKNPSLTTECIVLEDCLV